MEALLASLAAPCPACGTTGGHSPWCALRTEARVAFPSYTPVLSSSYSGSSFHSGYAPSATAEPVMGVPVTLTPDEHAKTVTVECGGRTFVYDGTGALVATDGVYEEGRGTPDEKAADALERARAWAGLNQQGTIPYQNGLVDALQSSSLHGLSSSTAPNYGVANAAMNDATSGVVNALGQAEAK